VLTKGELVEVLGLSKDEFFADNVKREFTPLLVDLVETIKLNHSVRPNRQPISCQTEDSPAFDATMTLE
jgi:hypothetical protein